jgi:hypothetical protein
MAMNVLLNGKAVGGTWVKVSFYLAANGKYVCVGTGTNGNVYAQESADGVTWTRPSGDWPF